MSRELGLDLALLSANFAGAAGFCTVNARHCAPKGALGTDGLARFLQREPRGPSPYSKRNV